MNPQDRFRLEHLDRVVSAASEGLVPRVDDLPAALRLAFVGWVVATNRGEKEHAEYFLALQTEAIALLPELRVRVTAVEGAAHSLEAEHSAKEAGDLSYRAPAVLESVRRRGRIVVPRGGIPYRCEVCEQTASLMTAKARIVVPVAWGPMEAANGPARVVAAGLGELYRLVVCCRRCVRRKLSRCRNELWDGDAWLRCGRLAVGANYCEEDRGRPALRERKDPRRRRTPDQPSSEDYRFGSGARGTRLVPRLVSPR